MSRRYICSVMESGAIKILVVDDEADIIEFLQYNLAKEGFEVFSATNGEEAIKMASEKRPDLIILDIMMPGLNGIEVCEKLREKPEFKNTVIVFLTARNEDFTQIAGYDSGGDDFIAKPIRPRVLVSRIKALLRRRYERDGSAKTIVELEGIKIDKEKVMVYKDEQPVTLAKKEFELLSLLASKPGKLFTREEIFNRVWGPDQIIGDRTIDVHIRKLREKLGDTYIKTIKGMGYKINL